MEVSSALLDSTEWYANDYFTSIYGHSMWNQKSEQLLQWNPSRSVKSPSGWCIHVYDLFKLTTLLIQGTVAF